MIIGVDEAGRGPLAGEVFAAAVILDPTQSIAGLTDSKKLSAKRRELLAEQIKQRAPAWAIASASVEEIDRLNILHATMLAMRRAIEKLLQNTALTPTEIFIDGNRLPPDLPLPARAIIKGDASIAEISAASILAKTARDATLIELDARYPQYGFAKHKAYGTAAHLQALAEHGAILGVHRQSFAPVKKVLNRP